MSQGYFHHNVSLVRAQEQHYSGRVIKYYRPTFAPPAVGINTSDWRGGKPPPWLTFPGGKGAGREAGGPHLRRREIDRRAMP
jgi:hypothetical protein